MASGRGNGEWGVVKIRTPLSHSVGEGLGVRAKSECPIMAPALGSALRRCRRGDLSS